MEEITVSVWIGKFSEGQHWCHTTFSFGRPTQGSREQAPLIGFKFSNKRNLALRLLDAPGNSYEALAPISLGWQMRRHGVYTVPDGTWAKIGDIARIVSVSKRAIDSLVTTEEISAYISSRAAPGLKKPHRAVNAAGGFMFQGC
ncbi:MAG: hypothetical protein JRN62_02780 [Nitrososphaerota archaeon]|nr:hypothetical protein [Nitrososphaerota archaeon]MDG6948922.1 hypothetical protein [Nitrososphaerota archaeon]